ncbi:hypothetical protein Dsin_009980 [Dipteronia sinensis]|uniref:MULE transposase domain-containing protein n=1 Tax=Dipteronia sinensis TaxID=43782 RepID=A0AAE0EDZ5_9ROSI|nr:hypothetical protein Dsin_009980 [Dipteronia sinensis]
MPFIGVDGCHLKGLAGGVLLSDVALDANNGLFSLAVCICEKETQLSWERFLNNLKIHLKYLAMRNLTFMSNRQKCVIAALEKHFPFIDIRGYGNAGNNQMTCQSRRKTRLPKPQLERHLYSHQSSPIQHLQLPLHSHQYRVHLNHK